MTLIGAMSIRGVVATKAIPGSMKGKDFREFVSSDLMENLNPGDVVIMDNLNIHKMEGIEELIAKAGARVEDLPPYSPDFNPPIDVVVSNRQECIILKSRVAF